MQEDIQMKQQLVVGNSCCPHKYVFHDAITGTYLKCAYVYNNMTHYSTYELKITFLTTLQHKQYTTCYTLIFLNGVGRRSVIYRIANMIN